MNQTQSIPVRQIDPNEFDTSQTGIEQLSLYIERSMVHLRDYLPWLHALTFIAFVGLLAVPLFLADPKESATAWNDFTRFANYVMWGLWFPLVFVSVIFTGRSWCGVLCPMGAASELANKHGLQANTPRWISWSGTPVISFLLITILGQTLGVRDHPEAMAELFGGTMLLAIIIGLLYGKRKRVWCRHMCPIGLLLGVFSRIGAVQFSPKKAKPGGDRCTEKTICPTYIDLPYKTESRHCIECFRCVHPGKKTGLFFHFRKPGLEIENIRQHNPNLAEVLFLFLGTGTAIGGFLWLVLPHFQTWRMTMGEWFFSHGQFWVADAGPAWLMSVHPERREVFNWLDFFMISGYMIGWMLLVTTVLSCTTAVSAALSGHFGGHGSFRQRFVELGYQFAPVAMVSLVIGLGTELFSPLQTLGMSESSIQLIKAMTFIAGLLWSFWLGSRILIRQGLEKQVLIALTPGALGSLSVAMAWWPAVL